MNQSRQTGVLLVNLGTPDELTTKSVKAYLKEFLSDRRVIEIPPILWQIILRGVILNVRPKKSKAKYAEIWSEQGSPLLVISQQQAQKVAAKLGDNFCVKLAMRYGNPSIASQLDAFAALQIKHIIVLPLYPQYCAATTASVFDKISEWMQRSRNIFGLTFIKEYYQNEAYIMACVNALQQDIEENGMPQKLIFSFHGMPEITAKKGDPYYTQCLSTTALITQKMGLQPSQYQVVFQSRFGAQAWLKPYAYTYLEQIAKEGIESVAVFCPGFSADCLETLEEMAQENKMVFIQAGGKFYRYIEALNERAEHIDLLADIVRNHTPRI